MAKTYTAVKGDTYRKIAAAIMGDADLANTLADYNGIVDLKQIVAGQQISIPTARDLAPSRAPRPRAAAWPAPPAGLQNIIDTFGNLLAYVRNDATVDPKWETQFMVRQALPFAIPLDWNTSQSVTAIRCHKLLAPLFAQVFEQIAARGLRGTVKTYGGCYVYRPKRNGAKPSTHSWGIAFDLNVRTNQMGTAGDMDPRLVELIESFGFVWGGRWAGRGKDPIHFQYCSGY